MPSPKVISLFSGAGGLDFGLEAAGFAFGAGVEMDSDCVATLLESRPDWPVVCRSIFDVPTQELLDLSVSKKGDVDLVAGGPPCQPFSKAGYWARGDALRLSDPRSDTLGAYLRVVRETLPKVLLLGERRRSEVRRQGRRAAASPQRAGGHQQDSRALRTCLTSTFSTPPISASHSCASACLSWLIETAEHSLFQGRHTFLRTPRGVCWTATSEPYRTAWDALGDVTVSEDEDLAVRGKWADLLPSIPEGSNYLHHTDRGEGVPLFGWRRRYWTFLLKLAKNRPSWTIQAQPGPAVGPFHWSNRRLSVRELSRLQTFPDDVNIVGGRGSAQKQLGNAVPSLLAEVMGRAIREQLLDLPVGDLPLKLLPRRRTPVPPPEPVASVPERYAGLVGEHSPHPGTGLGHAASRRAQFA